MRCLALATSTSYNIIAIHCHSIFGSNAGRQRVVHAGGVVAYSDGSDDSDEDDDEGDKGARPRIVSFF